MKPALFVFVGERPSPLAFKRGATWQNAAHAGRTLHDTLQALGLEPSKQFYLNLWDGPEALDTDAVHAGAVCSCLREFQRNGLTIVAMGQKVARELKRAGIDHLQVVHPAARGLIRRRERYVAHVREVLL